MTDDLMDERLRAAGERWRAAHPGATDLPEHSDEIDIQPSPKQRQRWITAASAAVVAAALIVGGIVIATNRDNAPPSTHAALPPAASVLAGRTWTLSRDASTTLRFASDSVVIHAAGCVMSTVATHVAGHTLSFGAEIGNGSACGGPPPGAPAEHLNRILAILTGTVGWAVVDNRLTLTKAGVGTLTYRAATADVPSTDPAGLTGHSWQLTQTEAGDGSGTSQSASGGSAISRSVVIFDGTGRFTVEHRCYTDQGDADLGSGTAVLTHVALKVAIPCASNAETKAGQNENDLVDSVLTGHVTWAITGTELTVTKGGKVLTFG
jgi:hypothetical protein